MKSFINIHQEYRSRILQYLEKMVGKDYAEDLCQEVFFKVDQSLKNFKEKSSISTWIYRIATNVAYDKLRTSSFKQKTNEHSINEKQITQCSSEPNSEQKIIKDEMNDCIQSYVQDLPEDYRAVIFLSEFEELKNREIAEILGITIENVKIRLHRGKASLKERFEKGCNLYYDEQNVLSCEHK